MHQDKIDDCMRRVRSARGAGLSMVEAMEHFGNIYNCDMVFFAWHAACILDNDDADDKENS